MPLRKEILFFLVFLYIYKRKSVYSTKAYTSYHHVILIGVYLLVSFFHKWRLKKNLCKRSVHNTFEFFLCSVVFLLYYICHTHTRLKREAYPLKESGNLCLFKSHSFFILSVWGVVTQPTGPTPVKREAGE